MNRSGQTVRFYLEFGASDRGSLNPIVSGAAGGVNRGSWRVQKFKGKKGAIGISDLRFQTGSAA